MPLAWAAWSAMAPVQPWEIPLRRQGIVFSCGHNCHLDSFWIIFLGSLPILSGVLIIKVKRSNITRSLTWRLFTRIYQKIDEQKLCQTVKFTVRHEKKTIHEWQARTLRAVLGRGTQACRLQTAGKSHQKLYFSSRNMHFAPIKNVLHLEQSCSLLILSSWSGH